MKTKLFVLIMLLSTLLMVGEAKAQAKMNVPVDSIDFGYAPEGNPVCCRFWLYSTGTDTLKIIRVRTSCGCTQAPLEKDVVAPGDSTSVEITFTPTHYTGRVSKTAYVSANTGEPERKLTITVDLLAHADSASPARFSPYAVDLTPVRDKKHKEMKFSIRNVSASNLTPRLIISPGDLFDVRLPKTIKPGEDAEGVIKLKAAPARGYMKSFTVAFDDAQGSRFTVPVKELLSPSAVPQPTH